MDGRIKRDIDILTKKNIFLILKFISYFGDVILINIYLVLNIENDICARHFQN